MTSTKLKRLLKKTWYQIKFLQLIINHFLTWQIEVLSVDKIKENTNLILQIKRQSISTWTAILPLNLTTTLQYTSLQSDYIKVHTLKPHCRYAAMHVKILTTLAVIKVRTSLTAGGTRSLTQCSSVPRRTCAHWSTAGASILTLTCCEGWNVHVSCR